jgi:large subunit ribosomal protein L14
MNWRRSPRVIHVYTKTGVASVGDKILLAVKGQKQKAIVVGSKNYQRNSIIPNYDTNNCVLVDDQNTPLGTRITVPIPSLLRGNPSCSKIVAIATKFI